MKTKRIALFKTSLAPLPPSTWISRGMIGAFFFGFSMVTLGGCQAPSSEILDSGQTQNAGPTPSPVGPSQPSRTFQTGALLFAGAGTWSSEVNAVESLLRSKGTTYQKVTSNELNAMTLDQMGQFGTLIFPGGNGATEANSLSSATRQRIRDAVQKLGVGYVGFCAGAFISQAPAPSGGGDVSYGLGVVDGPVLDYYYLENQGVTTAITNLSLWDGSTLDVLWYGGPVTQNEGVLARYPDGSPAISQLRSGAGLVSVTGGHPVVSQATLASLGFNLTTAQVSQNQEFTFKLIESSILQTPIL